MNLQSVIERFSIVAKLSIEETSPWIDLCKDSTEEIERNLKSDVDIELNSRRLESAAAALSFYKYTLYRASASGMESFSAGELKIKNDCNSSVRIASTIWREAKKSISDLLKDTDFAFERIEF